MITVSSLHLVKKLATNLVNDVQFCSAYKYCKDESSLAFRSPLDRMMKWDWSFIEVMKGRNRGHPELVQAALLALERLVPPRDVVKARPSLEAIKASLNLEAAQSAIAETRSSIKSVLG